MKDYVGQWFQIYRRNQEPADILFEIAKNGKSESVFFPHENADGVGALFTIAEQRGWKIYNEAIRQTYLPISKWTYFKNCILFLYWTKPRIKNIWKFEFSKSETPQCLQAKTNFSDMEVSELNKALRAKGISLNTALFHSLHLAVAEKFEFDTSLKSWWIPVNMRNDLGFEPNDSTLKKNYVSNFTADVSHSWSANQFQKTVSTALKQRRHWATWWWQQLGRYLPESIIEKIAISNLKNTYYVGAFTNLGDWTCSERNQVTVFANPLLSHPIGAAAIIWNGALNISLRVYPSFPIDQVDLDLLMAAWKRKIREIYLEL